MIFGVAQLVSYLSRFMTLLPGDLITTGTPPGVGMGIKPPGVPEARRRDALGIEKLGEQQQTVHAWDPALIDINAAIYTKLNYDVARDFVPVALFCTAPNVMVASPGTPVKTVAEFVAYAKANPGKLNYASGGIGSSSHLSAELLKSMAGFDMTHVPYKGARPAVNAVLANEVNVMIGNLPPWQGHLKAGKVQALAVTTATRHAGLPDVPALAETYAGFETVAWFGLLAPTGTPKAVVDRVNQAVNTALADPEVRNRIAATGCGPSPLSQEVWAARVQGDITRWKKLATERNIRAD
jgi:tripartite-type tricarboxylate transporter receptor subunit TctC